MLTLRATLDQHDVARDPVALGVEHASTVGGEGETPNPGLGCSRDVDRALQLYRVYARTLAA